jgi:RNA polymerase sigma-70 factor (ECF subfamily)
VFRPRAAEHEEALRRVFGQHFDAVYAFFAYSVGASIAEDLTASTFERVVRSWGRFDERRSSERTWILSIARNLLVDHYRRERHRQSISTDAHPDVLERFVVPGDALERRLTIEELKAWLRPLTPREREIIALRYGADLPGAEIAQLLGLSESNVHQILSRALRRLREAAALTPDGRSPTARHSQRLTRRSTDS